MSKCQQLGRAMLRGMVIAFVGPTARVKEELRKEKQIQAQLANTRQALWVQLVHKRHPQTPSPLIPILGPHPNTPCNTKVQRAPGPRALLWT